MNPLAREFLLLRRSRASLWAIFLLLLLSGVAAYMGQAGIARQRDQQAALVQQQASETAALASWIETTHDAGYAAYYHAHATWNAPGALAFAALGFRDVAPQTLRIKALGLEAQLYENEFFNPEIALVGRFDLAFVAIYLLPLFLIGLMHDMVSRERESGRLSLIEVAASGRPIWRYRVLLRTALACGAVLFPFVFVAAWEGARAGEIAGYGGVVVAYATFWSLVIRAVGVMRTSSAAHGAAMVSIWAMMTLALPSAAHAWIVRAVPVAQGVELTLAQRQAVHAAWDIPKEDTMVPFFESHPEWRDTAPITGRFHWKWYFAFHHVGDRHVAALAAEYRKNLLLRQEITGRIGWLLPPVAAQLALHRLAGTDLPAQLAYEDQIRSYHDKLRRFYYPYLFNEEPFGREDFGAAPRFASPD